MSRRPWSTRRITYTRIRCLWCKRTIGANNINRHRLACKARPGTTDSVQKAGVL